jgi:hypothetical protein
MEFFNKKEEVLDVQLTEYGKYLLAQGRMKPAFYAFYDEEILYDVAKVASSNEGVRVEDPKDADRRIRYETPNLKPQSNTTGVETRVREFLKSVESNINKKALSVNSINFADAFENVPHFDQKFFVATDPLGTSDLKSEYAPAWGVNMLSNEISSSQDYYTLNLTSSTATLNDGVIKEIPQIDITIDYKTFYTTDTRNNNGKDFVITNANDNGIFIAVKHDYILIDLQEHNTVYEKENFLCEVFLSSSAGIRKPASGSSTDNDTSLQQLDYQNAFLAPVSQNNIEYFLNFDFDFGIPLDVALIYGINERSITHNDALTPGTTTFGDRHDSEGRPFRSSVEGDVYGTPTFADDPTRGTSPESAGAPGGDGDWMGIAADDEEPC